MIYLGIIWLLGVCTYIWWYRRSPKVKVIDVGRTASPAFEDDMLDLMLNDSPFTFAATTYLSLETEPPEKEDEQ